MTKHMRAYRDVVAADGDVSRAEEIAERYNLSSDYVKNWIVREKRDALLQRPTR